MPLISLEIKQSSPQESDVWLSCEKGLRLLIKPNGAKYWRMRYHFVGKQTPFVLGVYPEITPKGARIAWNKACLQRAEGFDPMVGNQVLRKSAF